MKIIFMHKNVGGWQPPPPLGSPRFKSFGSFTKKEYNTNRPMKVQMRLFYTLSSFQSLEVHTAHDRARCLCAIIIEGPAQGLYSVTASRRLESVGLLFS